MAPTKQKKDFYLVHMAIGIGHHAAVPLSALKPANVTDTGMEILGIFIGTLYLWSTSDPIWSSVLAIFLTGLSGYADMNTVLTSTFGTPILVQVFFLLTLINCLIENNLTEYCGRFFLTRKSAQDGPGFSPFSLCWAVCSWARFMGGFTPVFCSGLFYTTFLRQWG